MLAFVMLRDEGVVGPIAIPGRLLSSSRLRRWVSEEPPEPMPAQADLAEHLVAEVEDVELVTVAPALTARRPGARCRTSPRSAQAESPPIDPADSHISAGHAWLSK